MIMRVSTKTIFESGVARMNELQAGLLKTQQQLSTGRRMLTPADDPVASARALEVTQSQEINSQFGLNRQSVKSSLSLEEGVLQSVTSLIQDVKEATVNAGNGVHSDTERKFIATELKLRLEELVGLANSRDGNGNYFFGGHQSATQPFTPTAGGAQYHGDQGQRLLQVEAARQLALNDPGDAVFMQIRNGNGTFATSAQAGNTGTGVISSGTPTASGLLASSYKIVFSGGGQNYSVFDVSADPAMTGAPLQSGTYASGQAISFQGVQVEISGAPADNDTFAINPSTNQSMFATISNLISVLDTPVSGAAARANLQNGLNAAHVNLGNMLDHVLTVRAEVGTRLKEIDALDSAGADRHLQYSQTLSELQDLDYVKAISELTHTRTTLEAAQKSFTKISGLSLFNFL
jgi:flagellar hook-associated protein 3 FlgL